MDMVQRMMNRAMILMTTAIILQHKGKEDCPVCLEWWPEEVCINKLRGIHLGLHSRTV